MARVEDPNVVLKRLPLHLCEQEASWELKKLPKSINHLPHLAPKAGIISFWPIPAYFHIFHIVPYVIPVSYPFSKGISWPSVQGPSYWDTKEAVATAASGLAQKKEGGKAPQAPNVQPEEAW